MSDSEYQPTSNPRVFLKDGKLYVKHRFMRNFFTPYRYGSKQPYPKPIDAKQAR